ncbi:MAG: STAS domain-containing protein, partial [Nitrososphaeria archaeon]|nr:STAS domain-containing protein [Nitrososphaeria archaeon]
MEEIGRASFVEIEDFLLTCPQEAMHDLAAILFKDDVLRRVRETKINGLILDLSRIDIVDSFMGRAIGEIADSVVLLGIEVVVIGLRPEVAITMVEMGVSLGQVHPLLNLDLA